LLKKRYNWKQIAGASVTIIGLGISMIPVLLDVETGGSAFWPLIYIVGMAIYVLWGITEESIFRDNLNKFDRYYLMAYDCSYQFIIVLLLFWTDIIPDFGTSSSFSQWDQSMINGFTCFMAPSYSSNPSCSYCSLLGILYAVSFYLSYIYAAAIMQSSSANSNAILSGIYPVLVVYFWILFPDLNNWAGGSTYDIDSIMYYSVSLPIITIGVIIFRRYEQDDFKEIDEQLDHSLNQSLMMVGDDA